MKINAKNIDEALEQIGNLITEQAEEIEKLKAALENATDELETERQELQSREPATVLDELKREIIGELEKLELSDLQAIELMYLK